MTPGFCIFEYCYRDASNYRAHEWLLLAGSATPENDTAIRETLIDSTWFVAEQAGIPTLYHRLEHYSGGPTDDDHCWHEFVRLSPATHEDHSKLQVFGVLTDIIHRLRTRSTHNAS